MKRLYSLFIAAAVALSGVFSLPVFAQSGTPLVAGTVITMQAESDGTAPITFEWFRGSQKVGEGATYVIPSLSAADAGPYTVKATNMAGSATSAPYVLVIAVPPSTPTIKVTAAKPQTVTVQVPPGTRVTYSR